MNSNNFFSKYFQFMVGWIHGYEKLDTKRQTLKAALREKNYRSIFLTLLYDMGSDFPLEHFKNGQERFQL